MPFRVDLSGAGTVALPACTTLWFDPQLCINPVWQVYTCNLDTWEVKAGGPEVQSHFQLVVSS